MLSNVQARVGRIIDNDSFMDDNRVVWWLLSWPVGSAMTCVNALSRLVSTKPYLQLSFNSYWFASSFVSNFSSAFIIIYNSPYCISIKQSLSLITSFVPVTPCLHYDLSPLSCCLAPLAFQGSCSPYCLCYWLSSYVPHKSSCKSLCVSCPFLAHDCWKGRSGISKSVRYCQSTLSA